MPFPQKEEQGFLPAFWEAIVDEWLKSLSGRAGLAITSVLLTLGVTGLTGQRAIWIGASGLAFGLTSVIAWNKERKKRLAILAELQPTVALGFNRNDPRCFDTANGRTTVRIAVYNLSLRRQTRVSVRIQTCTPRFTFALDGQVLGAMEDRATEFDLDVPIGTEPTKYVTLLEHHTGNENDAVIAGAAGGWVMFHVEDLPREHLPALTISLRPSSDGYPLPLTLECVFPKYELPRLTAREFYQWVLPPSFRGKLT
jgi:hypothetical protein